MCAPSRRASPWPWPRASGRRALGSVRAALGAELAGELVGVHGLDLLEALVGVLRRLLIVLLDRVAQVLEHRNALVLDLRLERAHELFGRLAGLAVGPIEVLQLVHALLRLVDALVERVRELVGRRALGEVLEALLGLRADLVRVGGELGLRRSIIPASAGGDSESGQDQDKRRG